MATSKIQKTVMSATLNATADTDADYISGWWHLSRVGSIVFLHCDNMKAMPAGSFTESVKLIPAEYRPNTGTVFTLVRRATTPTPLAMQVKNTGELLFYNYGSATSAVTPYSQTVSWAIEP